MTIAVIAGVPVRIHWTFLVLLAWVFGAGVFKGGSLADGAKMLALVSAVFACVVAHEFGHILSARSFGIRTRDVTLLPIGGVATLERMPEKPWQELVVAVAGPLVNVVIAAALLPGLLWRGDLSSLATLAEPGQFERGFVLSLATINVWLVLFNMIPAFPMDGGRVLRAILAMFMEPMIATRIASNVGQVMAVGLAMVGLLGGMPLLLVIALFVFLSAGSEVAGVEARELLRHASVSDIMMREFHVLADADLLSTAVEKMLAGAQADFPVTRDGGTHSPIVGILTRADLLGSLSRHGAAATVGGAMGPPCPIVQEADPAYQTSLNLQTSERPLIAVLREGTLVGLVTRENIAEAILVRKATRHHAGPPARAAAPHSTPGIGSPLNG